MRGVILPSSVKNQRFLPASPQGEAFGRCRASARKQQFTATKNTKMVTNVDKMKIVVYK
jgi:hypothetical protein